MNKHVNQNVKAAAIAPRIGLALCLPFSGKGTPPEFALSLHNQIYPSNILRATIAVKGKPVDQAREELVEKAIAQNAKYVQFIDEDLSFPDHTCRTLMDTLKNADDKTMIAGGIYCWKMRPCEPLVYREKGEGTFMRWKLGDVFECGGLATGAMLIRTELFKHIKKPWFKTIDEVGYHQTEDMYFCDKVREAGFKILADSNALCIHWGWNEQLQQFIPYYPADDSYPMRPVSADEPRCERKWNQVVEEVTA